MQTFMAMQMQIMQAQAAQSMIGSNILVHPMLAENGERAATTTTDQNTSEERAEEVRFLRTLQCLTLQLLAKSGDSRPDFHKKV